MSQKPLQVRKQQPKEGELLEKSTDNGHLINQSIVQILVERNNPDEVEKLMRAELDYNRERLSILREHTELHPDAIEDRNNKRFRRTQYLFLMLFDLVIVGVLPFVQTAVAVSLCSLALIITSGVVINGRDRDNDSELLSRIVDKLIRREQ
jgi:hypothetical protein